MLRVLIIRSQLSVSTRREPKKRTTKIFFSTDYIINNAIYEYGDFKQWLDFENEMYEGYGYDFEFLGLRGIQIKIEPTKASIGSYIDLRPFSKVLNQY